MVIVIIILTALIIFLAWVLYLALDNQAKCQVEMEREISKRIDPKEIWKALDDTQSTPIRHRQDYSKIVLFHREKERSDTLGQVRNRVCRKLDEQKDNLRWTLQD